MCVMANVCPAPNKSWLYERRGRWCDWVGVGGFKFGARVECCCQGFWQLCRNVSQLGDKFSLIAFTTMVLLTIMEVPVYKHTWLKYEYEVDKDFSSKLRISIDIAVTMKCQYVGPHVLDLVEKMVTSTDGLVMDQQHLAYHHHRSVLQLTQSRLQKSTPFNMWYSKVLLKVHQQHSHQGKMIQHSLQMHAEYMVYR